MAGKKKKSVQGVGGVAAGGGYRGGAPIKKMGALFPWMSIDVPDVNTMFVE